MKYTPRPNTILCIGGRQINLDLLSQEKLAQLQPKFPHLIRINDNAKRKSSQSDSPAITEGDAPSID